MLIVRARNIDDIRGPIVGGTSCSLAQVYYRVDEDVDDDDDDDDDDECNNGNHHIRTV